MGIEPLQLPVGGRLVSAEGRLESAGHRQVADLGRQSGFDLDLSAAHTGAGPTKINIWFINYYSRIQVY